MKKIDIKGHTFNRLTVIDYDKDKMWNCICECGGLKQASSYQLTKGTVKSCGCLLKETAKENGLKNDGKSLVKDLVGKVFNRLTVLSYYEKGYWICKCICGTEKKVETCHLNSGATQSCGCLGKRKIL